MRGTHVSRALLPLLLTLAVGVACEGPPRPPEVGRVAPRLELPDRAGVMRDLSDFEGQVVLLNLWATWCVPCRAEMPQLQEAHEHYGPEGFTVLGVNVDNRGAADAVAGFLETVGVEYPVLMDPSSVSMDLYSVMGLPASYLLDREGVVRYIRVGPILEKDPEFWGAVESALGRPLAP